ncbi:hypothetical protein [Curtobacterium flaccumfaciens]|uniref:hypothetical protein n=1 Tax=Curtobacterium flaccumfaciens TaxID=2035 RepID=UPI001ADA9C40|nr:hypothetical protein [Curtobacterium flaccumfaciens]MBO9049336.1 hypothetical protein [Curtobacterium flaccumfaciens pv. flaccumfaciens]
MADDGWIVFEDEPKLRVIRKRFRRVMPWIIVLGTATVFVSRGGPSPFRSIGWLALPIWFVGYTLVVLGLWQIVRWQTRPFAVDVDRSRIRIRGRELTFADVDVAELDPPGNEEADGLSLRFGVRRGRKASILVRAGREATITGAHRTALLAVIDGSSIVRPTDPHDPSGRFARHNFPGTLDKAAAAQVIEDPPQVGEPAP